MQNQLLIEELIEKYKSSINPDLKLNEQQESITLIEQCLVVKYNVEGKVVGKMLTAVHYNRSKDSKKDLLKILIKSQQQHESQQNAVIPEQIPVAQQETIQETTIDYDSIKLISRNFNDRIVTNPKYQEYHLAAHSFNFQSRLPDYQPLNFNYSLKNEKRRIEKLQRIFSELSSVV